MKLYGDTLSPFVRMCLVTAHEVGLGTKIQREISRVDPTTVNAGQSRPVVTSEEMPARHLFHLCKAGLGQVCRVWLGSWLNSSR